MPSNLPPGCTQAEIDRHLDCGPEPEWVYCDECGCYADHEIEDVERSWRRQTVDAYTRRCTSCGAVHRVTLDPYWEVRQMADNTDKNRKLAEKMLRECDIEPLGIDSAICSADEDALKHDAIASVAQFLAQREAEIRAELRTLVADYMGSEGCSCCRGSDHEDHRNALCKALDMRKYSDGSGYDYGRYQSKGDDDE